LIPAAAVSARSDALKSRLTWVDPQTAALGNRALAALSAVRLVGEGGPLRLRAETTADPEPAVYLRFDSGRGLLALAPEVIDGRPSAWLREAATPDLPEALATMSRLEPLIAALESACGLPLEPESLGPSLGLSFRVRALDGAGRVAHQLWVALAPSLVASWPTPEFDPGELGAAVCARVDASLRIDGAAVRRSELAALQVGDLVWLPVGVGGAWPARLTAAGRASALTGRLDPRGLAFTVTMETTPMLDPAPPLEPEAASPPGDFAPDLSVRLRVALGELRLTVGEIAGLRPGSVLALPASGDDLPVELLADETPIARGRLVALGEAYGVMIDALASERAGPGAP